MVKTKIKRALLFSLILSAVLFIGQAGNVSAASKKLAPQQIGLIKNGVSIKWNKIDGASYYEITRSGGQKRKISGTSAQLSLADGKTEKIYICPMDKNNKKVKGSSKSKLEICARPEIPYYVNNGSKKLGIKKNYNKTATVLWKKTSKKYNVRIKLVSYSFLNGKEDKTQTFYTKGSKGKYVFKGLRPDRGYMVYVDVSYATKKDTIYSDNYGYFTVGQKVSKCKKIYSGKNYNKKFKWIKLSNIQEYKVLPANDINYKTCRDNTITVNRNFSYVTAYPTMPDNVLRNKSFSNAKPCYMVR